MNAQTFAKKIEETIKSVFPDSGVDASFSAHFCPAISIYFTLGADKEWQHGISRNDALEHRFSIGYDQIDKDGKMAENVTLERSAGSISIKSKDPRFAYQRIKLGFRKTTGSPEKLLEYLKKYFNNLKTVAIANVDDLDNFSSNLLRSKFKLQQK